MSQARLSAERLAEIRNAGTVFNSIEAMTVPERHRHELLIELDAVTRERDALSSRLDDFISAHVNGRSANDD